MLAHSQVVRPRLLPANLGPQTTPKLQPVLLRDSITWCPSGLPAVFDEKCQQKHTGLSAGLYHVCLYAAITKLDI